MEERFEEVYERWQQGVISCYEASELLHCSIKTFYRKRQLYESEGGLGIIDKRIGNKPPNALAVDKVNHILCLTKKYYEDYNGLHLQQELDINHNLSISYTSLCKILRMNGMFKIGRKPRKKHRKRRKPKAMTGMMIHQDGSTHNWLPHTTKKHDLIITMDDANNEVYSAFLCEEEGTFSSFKGIRDVITKKGLFSCFYVDRGSHYGHTAKAGNKVDLSKPTQISRALKQLGIHIIYSRCPQGRGRSERMFRTWQGRLPQELKKHNIRTLEGANDYINNSFLPKMNNIFKRKAISEETGFIAYVGRSITEILSIQAERVVNNDNTISYKNQILQLPKNSPYECYVKSKVIIHEYEDGVLEVFYGPRKLAKFIINNQHNQGNYDDLEEIKIAA